MAERFFGEEIEVRSIRDSNRANGHQWRAWLDYYPPEKVKVYTDIAWDIANNKELKYSPSAIKGNITNVFKDIKISFNDIKTPEFFKILRHFGSYCDEHCNNILTKYTKQSALKLTDGKIFVPVTKQII